MSHTISSISRKAGTWLTPTSASRFSVAADRTTSARLKAHDLINFYATAFFETYVAGDQSYARFLDPQAKAGDPDVTFQSWAP